MLSKKQRKMERRRKINIAKLARKIAAQELLREKELASTKSLKDEEDRVRVKRLGPEKFVEPEVEVALSDEIPQTMRLVNSRQNLLRDRFTGLQKRNLIEPRTLKNYHRRFALKVKEKRLYREYALQQAKRYSNM